MKYLSSDDLLNQYISTLSAGRSEKMEQIYWSKDHGQKTASESLEDPTIAEYAYAYSQYAYRHTSPLESVDRWACDDGKDQIEDRKARHTCSSTTASMSEDWSSLVDDSQRVSYIAIFASQLEILLMIQATKPPSGGFNFFLTSFSLFFFYSQLQRVPLYLIV